MKRFLPFFAILFLTLSDSAFACSVCFGDPDSPMTKGAVAGVYVMMGFIGFVLTGIAGTACFWMFRSRHIDMTQRTHRTTP